jgi:hypothetical protein
MQIVLVLMVVAGMVAISVGYLYLLQRRAANEAAPIGCQGSCASCSIAPSHAGHSEGQSRQLGGIGQVPNQQEVESRLGCEDCSVCPVGDCEKRKTK